MYPTLIKIGNFPIHTYGVLIATGFLLCVWWAKCEAERLKLDADRIIDLGFWALLVGMIGSRFLFVITRWSHFAQNPIEAFYVWEGGLVFWGGPLLCIPFFLWYTKKYKLPRLKIYDIGGQCVPLAHAFGRLGCFSTGCCYGRPTDQPWGIKLFSDVVEPSSRGISIHPVQLYESALLFILFFVLVSVRKKKKFDGQIAALYLIAYAMIRMVTESFRGDFIRGFVIPELLSTSQFISLLVIAGASIWMWKLWKRQRASS